MSTKAAVKKEETPLAVVADPSMFDDVGTGLEDASVEDFAIPFVGIVQALSPQRKKEKPEFIAGAEEGDIFNSVSQELFGEGVTVIPCYHSRNELEWVLREEDGGLVDIHPAGYEPPHGTERDDRNRDRVLDENGKMTNHQMVRTHSYYVLVIKADGSLEKAIINMSSTQIKKAKRWNTLLTNLKVEHNGKMTPVKMQAMSFTLSTTPESNKNGDWYGWLIEQGSLVTGEQFKAAMEFYESVKAGEVKAQYEGDNAKPDDEDEDLSGEDDLSY